MIAFNSITEQQNYGKFYNLGNQKDQSVYFRMRQYIMILLFALSISCNLGFMKFNLHIFLISKTNILNDLKRSKKIIDEFLCVYRKKEKNLNAFWTWILFHVKFFKWRR